MSALDPIRRAIAEAAIAAARRLLPSSGPQSYNALLQGAQAEGVTVGVGLHVSGGVGTGITAGIGLVLAPEGPGVYFTAGFLAGFFADVDGSIQFAFVRGGINDFGGPGMALSVGGGHLGVVSLSALFDMQRNPVGFAFSIGAGESPFGIYLELSRTWVNPLHKRVAGAYRPYSGYGSASDRGRQIHPRLGAEIDRMRQEGVSDEEIHAALDELSMTAAAPMHTTALGETSGSLPTAHLLSSLGGISGRLARVAVNVLLEALPNSGAWSETSLIGRVAREGVTVGIGVQGSAGILAGPSAGFGLVFSPQGIGYYGSLGLAAGLVVSASATVQLTIVAGGIDRFRGHALAVTVAGGEGIVGSGSILLDQDRNFLGVSGAVGIGVGSPIEIYLEAQQTHAETFARRVGSRGFRGAPGLRTVVGARAFTGEMHPELARLADELVNEGAASREEVDAFLGAGMARAAGRSRRIVRVQTDEGEGVTVHLPGGTVASGWQVALVERAIDRVAPTLGTMIRALRAAANRFNVTIGIGVAVSGGALAGAGLGAGIMFAPGNVVGFYGSASAAVGALFSVSATVQVTIVNGGISNFTGQAVGYTVAGGEGVVGSATLLTDTNGGFLGVSFEIGVGAGDPIEVYLQLQETRSLARGRAFSNSASAARSDAETLGPEVVRAVDDAIARGVNEDDVATFLADLVQPPSTAATLAMRHARAFNNDTSITWPSLNVLPDWQARIVEGLLLSAAAPGLASPILAVHALRALANEANVTIAIGVSLEGGVGVGGGLSAGVFFAPGDVMGYYGTLSAIRGWVSGASATVQVVVVGGGPESLSGNALAVTGAVNIPAGAGSVVAGASVLLRPDRSFLGVAFQLGVGTPAAGFNVVSLYLEAQRTYAATVQSLSA